MKKIFAIQPAEKEDLSENWNTEKLHLKQFVKTSNLQSFIIILDNREMHENLCYTGKQIYIIYKYGIFKIIFPWILYFSIIFLIFPSDSYIHAHYTGPNKLRNSQRCTFQAIAGKITVYLQVTSVHVQRIAAPKFSIIISQATKLKNMD